LHHVQTVTVASWTLTVYDTDGQSTVASLTLTVYDTLWQQ